jgi:amino acid transporter
MSHSTNVTPAEQYTDGNRPGRLKGGAISAVGAAVMAMAFMGPAAAVTFNTAPGAAKIGLALPFGILLAMLVCLIVAYTIGSFSRRLPSAGFAHTFNTAAYGKGTGFVSGWILLISYGSVGSMLFAAFGAFGSDFLKTEFGWNVPWWIISALIMIAVGLIGAAGISSSVKTSLIFLVLELGIILALFVTITGKGGAEGNSFAPFAPQNSLTGLSGIGFGMLWGILMFVGFESAGTLGEETQDPRRGVPRALFIAVIAVGIVYVFSGYAAAIGYGQSHVNDLAGDATPWTTLSNTYWGTNVAWLFALTVLNSQFANALAGSSAGVRTIFALGRERILHPRLGTTNRKDSPVAAWAAYIGFSAVITFVLGGLITPLSLYGFLGSLLALGIVILYILMNLGLPLYYRRQFPGEFSLFRHVILPVIGSVLLLLPIYGLLWPIPDWPFNLVPYILLVWVAGGVGYFLYLRSRHPERIEAMGRIWEPDYGQSPPRAEDPSPR